MVSKFQKMKNLKLPKSKKTKISRIVIIKVRNRPTSLQRHLTLEKNQVVSIILAKKSPLGIRFSLFWEVWSL